MRRASIFTDVRYGFSLSQEARATLRAMPKVQRRLIGHRMHLLCDDLAGDVKKLSALESSFRLRVGSFRVLFTLASDQINVFAIKNRRDSYA